VAEDFSPGSTPGNPAGFIVGKLNEGASARSALADFRAAGGAIGNETWFRLYGEVNDALAKSALAGSLDPFAIPSAADYASWTMGTGGQFATQVQVFFRDKDTGLIGHKEYTYKDAVPHTPAEGEQAAMDEYGDEETADNYDQAVLGTIVTNVFQTVAYGS